MTDYTKATGSSGTMMIRDTGTYVEFWLKASSSTYQHDLPWRYTIDNTTSGVNFFNFVSGGNWQRLARWNITYDQTVNFYLYDTNTSGLGGPTSFSVAIDRTTVPPQPGTWNIKVVTNTYVQGDVDYLPNGGAALDTIQIRYDDDPNAGSPSYVNDNNLDGLYRVEGLTAGKTYYFWCRTHNAKGWSAWSGRTSATVKNVPPAPTTQTISVVKQRSFNTTYTSNGDGGSPITAWQTGYGTDPVTPEIIVTGATLTISDLIPGITYYVWGRGVNQWGNGFWSPRATVVTLGGVWIDVSGVKTRAVAYVNVDGVWKVAESYAKIAGLWKSTG